MLEVHFCDNFHWYIVLANAVNLSNIITKSHSVIMFAVVKIQTIFHTQIVDIFVINLGIKFHLIIINFHCVIRKRGFLKTEILIY
jgi:hypothetical protein